MEQISKELNDCRAGRYTKYPSPVEQLDMLWHMMDEAVISGKNSEFYNAVKAVKEQFPKPV